MGSLFFGFLIAGMYGPALPYFDEVPSAPYDLPQIVSEDTGMLECSSQVLDNAVQLREHAELYQRLNPDTAWGTQDLVDLLVDTGIRMRQLLPGSSPFMVGDISHPGGGPFGGHISHRGGMDVDLGLYRTGAWQDGRGLENVPFDELDIASNWLLVWTLLQSGRIDMILLDSAIINKLRAHTLDAGFLDPADVWRVFPAPGSRLERQAVGVVRHAPNHAGHLHVRILCPDGSRAR